MGIQVLLVQLTIHMLALVNLPIILSGMRVQKGRHSDGDGCLQPVRFTAGKHKRSMSPNGRSRDCPGSLWLRHGRIDFVTVVEDRKGRDSVSRDCGEDQFIENKDKVKIRNKV